jgi:hypothetical protein
MHRSRFASRPLAELPLSLRGRKMWHKSAPTEIVDAGCWTNNSRGWRLWRAYLANRKRHMADIDPSAGGAWLKWSAFDGWSVQRKRLQARLKRIVDHTAGRQWTQREIATLFGNLGRWHSHPTAALDCLAWAWHLPELSQTLDSGTWWDLLSRMLETAADADALSLAEHPMIHQLLSAELRLTLAFLFPELKPARRAAAVAVKSLAKAMHELASDEGSLPASRLAMLRPLLGCWTRSWFLSQNVKKARWPRQAQLGLAACIEAALHLLTQRRIQLLADEQQPWPKSLIRCAVAAAAEARQTAAQGVAIRRRRRQNISKLLSRRGDAAWQSDSAGYAILRSGWKPADVSLAVDHAAAEVRLQLWAAGQMLLEGAWKVDVRVDGQRRALAADWEVVCWVSDADVVYLELQAPLEGDIKIQRQILLGRNRRYVFLNDVVLGGEQHRIDYHGGLASASACTWQPADQSREVQLVGRNCRALFLPIGLSEWQECRCPGSLAIRGNRLELTMHGQRRSLAAPLFIALDRGKRADAFTWRQLTVAENRRIVPADEAVGYRVQIGRRQYLVYRALVGKRIRTVLGAHTGSEFLVSRITDDGELETQIEIE